MTDTSAFDVKEVPAEFFEWLQANAIPLASTEPGLDSADLEPFRAMIGDARVVTLGEVTHGSHEIFQMKRRLLEYLVDNLAFSSIGFETFYADGLAINEFISGESDVDPTPSLSSIWCWDIEEVRDLIYWTRNRNREAGEGHKVQFWGCEPLAPYAAVRKALEHVRVSNADLATTLARRLAPISTEFTVYNYSSASLETQRDVAAAVADLVKALPTGSTEMQLLSRAIEVGEKAQREAVFTDQLSARAGFWSDMIKFLTGQREPEGKMVSWAHNLHCQRKMGFPGLESIASRLSETFGDEYITIGTAFYTGEFRSIDVNNIEVSNFNVPPAKPGTFDAALSSVEYPLYAIDLRELPQAGPIDEWLKSGPSRRFVASSWSGSWREASPLEIKADPRDSFDVLVFVRSVHAARGLHNEFEFNPRPHFDPLKSNVLAAFDGACFEAVPGSTSSTWSRAAGIADSPYQLHVGNGAIQISGTEIPQKWWGDYVIFQTFDARPYLGKHIRFSGTICENSSCVPTARVFVQLNAASQETGGAAYQPRIPLLFESGVDNVEMFVQLETETITVGFSFYGRGEVIFSDPCLEVVDAVL